MGPSGAGVSLGSCVLLSGVALVSITGMVIIASEGDGPLVGTAFSTLRVDWLGDVHEFLANLTLLMVVTHVSGVLVSSFLEGEDLIKAMFTGRKRTHPYWEDVSPGKGKENQS